MADTVLLIVDMLSPYDFPGADAVAERAETALPALLETRARADERGIPVVYANDMHDGFHGSRELTFERALAGRRPHLVKPLEPGPGDGFIHKGQHSAFYGTPLAHLLHEWQVKEVMLTGQVTEQCILYTALDAHVRHYAVTVPADCVIAMDDELGRAALTMIERNLDGRVLRR